jgi:hypothetical protein
MMRKTINEPPNRHQVGDFQVYQYTRDTEAKTNNKDIEGEN